MRLSSISGLRGRDSIVQAKEHEVDLDGLRLLFLSKLKFPYF